MAKYSDAQLVERVNAVLYANSAGEISAVELRDLLLDFVDSKLSSNATIGIPVRGIFNSDDLVDNEIIVPHSLGTNFPIVFLKSPWADGDIWSAIHFSYGPSGSDNAWIHLEEDLPPDTAIEYIIVKFA